MLRKILMTVLLLITAFGISAPAICQIPDIADLFADCDFVREIPYITKTSEQDTLWFTVDAPNANAALFAAQTADWYGAIDVPVSSRSTGYVRTETKPVKRVLLYSRSPFYVRTWYVGGIVGSTVPIPIDTVTYDGQPSKRAGEYPCWTLIDWPDSCRVQSAGADSVKGKLGY